MVKLKTDSTCCGVRMKTCNYCRQEIGGSQDSISITRHYYGDAEELNYHLDCYDHKGTSDSAKTEIIDKLNSIITEAIEADCPGNILETADDIKISLTKMWGE